MKDFMCTYMYIHCTFAKNVCLKASESLTIITSDSALSKLTSDADEDLCVCPENLFGLPKALGVYGIVLTSMRTRR